jgi:hypothetical protein
MNLPDTHRLKMRGVLLACKSPMLKAFLSRVQELIGLASDAGARRTRVKK